MCNSCLSRRRKTDFRRLHQGLHAELPNAASAKCASARAAV